MVYHMNYCSDQCIRRTLYAVMFGVSPIIICLLLIGIARVILHCLEMSYNGRHKMINRRRRRCSLATYHHVGRPTLLYTPVSLTELHRIIQGEYQSQQQTDSSASSVIITNENSPRTSHFMNGILDRRDSSSPSTANTLANLVIRRSAINSTPFTALLIPPSTSDMNDDQTTPRRTSIVTIKRESIETTTLASMNNTINDASDSDQTDCDSIIMSPKKMTTTTTTTVIVEEYLDFHSARSIPYELNLVNSRFEDDS